MRDRGNVVNAFLIITLQALVSEDLGDSPPDCYPGLIEPSQIQSFVLGLRQADWSEHFSSKYGRGGESLT